MQKMNGGRNINVDNEGLKKIVIFGAGKLGKEAYCVYKSRGSKIMYFIDNSAKLSGTIIIDNIKCIGLTEYKTMISDDNSLECEVVVAVSIHNIDDVVKQLRETGINNYTVFGLKLRYYRERIVSYSQKDDMEDVILYNVFHDEKDIFYIDVGSNDPVEGSVTKLLYDKNKARGINIDPIKEYIDYANVERPEDINICVGLAANEGEMKIYLQGGLSTFSEANIVSKNDEIRVVKVKTLRDICKNYMAENQVISFLKIDVEGFEKDVLLGADFKLYRPKVMIIESTKPGTMEPSYYEWEDIITSNNYHFVYMCGVNRYYLADECNYLSDRFLTPKELKMKYKIYRLYEEFE